VIELKDTYNPTGQKPQRPGCLNTRLKQGYCGPCMWKWKCGNKRGETQKDLYVFETIEGIVRSISKGSK